MKAIKLLITLCVLLTAFLVGGMVLANDSAIFDSVSSDSTLAAPKFTVTIAGNKVTLSWNKVTGATEYYVVYVQYPYDNHYPTKTIEVGDKTTASYELSLGSSYHVAVKACKDSGSDCSDYSNIHDVIIPPGATFKNSLGQEFKLIPAGKFTMGSPVIEPFGLPDETQHQVTLTQPFYMMTTEVTQAQWEAVMGSNPSYISGCPTCPVEQVSWNGVQTYIGYMNSRGEGTYSLPTEAQWEYAVRAGSTTAFYNGGISAGDGDYDSNLNAIGWYLQNADNKIHLVAGKAPNAWGLYDMSGNVYEWCQDWYGDYPSFDVTDPTGPPSGPNRVVRGGHFNSYVEDCRSASRYDLYPDYGYYDVGFRLLTLP